jgi:hypothetical protein
VIGRSNIIANEKVFMKKGEFGTRQPVLVQGFVPMLSNFQLLHSIPSDGANVD